MDTLAGPLRDAGVEVVVAVGVTRPVEDETALLIHRAACEILLQIRDQPHVTLVAMGLVERGEQLTLAVEHNLVADDPEADTGTPRCPRRLEALSEQLARRGGALSSDRAVGRGARFTATLPG